MTAITWDHNSNLTSIQDNVHTGFDVKYDIDDLDDLDRVVRADDGSLSGGSITSHAREQKSVLRRIPRVKLLESKTSLVESGVAHEQVRER